MKAKEYLKILVEMMKLIDEGVHVVDSEGITIFYSTQMAQLEQSRSEDVLGKSFRQVFSHIPIRESTLFRAINKNIATYNKEQRYLNQFGKEIVTVNSTVPVIVDGKVIAAIEIASDQTTYKSMRDQILDLQQNVSKEFNKHNENSYYNKLNQYTFPDLIGRNNNFIKQVNIAKKAANTELSVFVQGETGTGKELIAQSIHYGSKRAGKPFLAQNCAALPENLLEGILFGTAKGSFVGAEDRVGLFEQANGGTLLLDELSAMPYDLQSKLLRALQENYIRRIGSNKDIPVNVRIIATVNDDPAALIAKGELRKDLFYRLSVINISLPPLRNRLDDIEVLSKHLLKKHMEIENKYLEGFTQGALDKLVHYDYPGNIRELENTIMSAVAMSNEDELLDENKIILNTAGNKYIDSHKGYNHLEMSLADYIGQIEKNIIIEALSTRRGNVSQTAELLGMKRQTLQHKMKKYELE